MAHINLIFTALNLKKLEKALVEEKLEAIKAHEDKSYKKKFKFRHIGVDIRESFKNCFKRIVRCSETSCAYKVCYKLSHEGSCENYFIKSLFGFIGGVFLTYFLYIIFIFQLNVKLTSATVICSFLGCVLTVGLAFSSRVRCVVLLTLPQFFSKRGRQALLGYAFVLALTGPVQNTLNNMGILSESLACGQVKETAATINLSLAPLLLNELALNSIGWEGRKKETFAKQKVAKLVLVRVIKSVFEFLGKIINICNKELGTPFERCTRVFENAIADCNAKLGPLFSWLCSITYIVKAVCYIVKIFDYICMIVDFISGSVVGVIIRKIKIFVRHIKTMFYVRIKFSHSFKYETKSSKSLEEIAKEIVAEIKDRSRGIVAFFKFMTSACMLFFLYLVFQVALYRIRYLTSERFDNIYITKYFREIDQRRAKLGKETVLPLTKKEQQTYVPISSGKLSRTEKRSLSKAITSLATASVKLGTHMLADYSLYWILTLISHHARYQSKVQAPNFPVAHVTGDGFLAKLLRAIVNAFQPVGIKLEIDTVPCLPIPIPPNFDRYIQIAVTVLLCWILTVLEPYGLRFRNYIMGYYYPLRAKQRTIWLYNHILRSRTSFLLLARRKLKKKFGMKGGSDEISCKDLLRSRLKCGIFRICFGSDLQKTCMLCGEVFREKEKSKFIKCHTPGCPGLFCLECFADLKNICPICLSPLEYGDLDDLDEEYDSSGDEPPPDKPKKKRRCPWFPCGKTEDDEEPLVPDDETDDQEEMEKPEDTGDKQDEGEEAEESDVSTDYSYSYQYDDENREPFPTPVLWRDVEKQAVPDDASMESFRDGDEYLHIDFDNKIRVPKGHAALVRMDVVAEVDEELDESKEKDDADDFIEAEEHNPLLDSCRCSVSSSPKHVEFIGVPNTVSDIHKEVRRMIKDLPYDVQCLCSDLDLTDEDFPKSTMSTSTRSDCKYCRCPNVDIRPTLQAGSETEDELRQIIPRLDLSFLQEQEQVCTCDNPVLSARFSYVTYQAVCETPRASPSNRSLESSSVLSSLNDSPIQNSEEVPLLRKRIVSSQHATSANHNRPLQRNEDKNNIKAQYSKPHVESPGSKDSYDFNKAQNRKVRHYYEATKELCADTRCSHGVKRRSISDMFRKLLPKRKKEQSYLPLHQQDTDEVVQIQSFNYSQQNWDTLSIDTNSPTYPFGSQFSSGSSEEEQSLTDGRRIRGGQCTHLINCQLIGRECPQKRVGSFDAKGRTKLKDFSTLSLPPRPKPAHFQQHISRYFFNIEDLSQPKYVETSMNPTEHSKGIVLKSHKDLTDRQNSSDYIIPRHAVSILTLRSGNTPPSSDSGLSENTCVAIFGNYCPQGLRKTSQEQCELPDAEILSEKVVEIEEEEVHTYMKHQEPLEEDLEAKRSVSVELRESKSSRQSSKEKQSSLISITKGKNSQDYFIPQQPSDSRRSHGSVEALKEAKTSQTKTDKQFVFPNNNDLPVLKTATEQSQISLDGSREHSKEKQLSVIREENQEDNLSVVSGLKTVTSNTKENEVESAKQDQSEEQETTSQTGRSLAKRKSTQLNQLLYKDDRTEISLVQKLSPDKTTAKSRLTPVDSAPLSPRSAPSVKLKISLHNSIIPEEDAQVFLQDPKDKSEFIEMRSLKSQDKIVETQESFPLKHDWLLSDSSRSGKLILSSDKTQQTSDNDIYRSSTVPEYSASSAQNRYSSAFSASTVPLQPRSTARTDIIEPSSDPRSGSSGFYYSTEPPERDAVCKNNNCRCSICKMRQMHQNLPAQTLRASRAQREFLNLGTNLTYEDSSCGCCRCVNVGNQRLPSYYEPTPPAVNVNHPGPRHINYQLTDFPPSTTDTELPEYVPPPPPRPPPLPKFLKPARQVTPPQHRRRPCSEQCNCCARHLYPPTAPDFSGDYSQPSSSHRYESPRDTYRFQGDYDPEYSDDPYEYPNPESSMSDLPYQNNEDYLELVHELQDTLHSRNRNRVKRAMQEFERRSKQNKPLEKPIINYDEASESEEPLMRKIDQLRTDRRHCCAEDKCSCGKKKDRPSHPRPPKPRKDFLKRERFEVEERPSHWTIDPSSGEWYKACKCKQRNKNVNGQPDFDQCACNCDFRYK